MTILAYSTGLFMHISEHASVEEAKAHFVAEIVKEYYAADFPDKTFNGVRAYMEDHLARDIGGFSVGIR